MRASYANTVGVARWGRLRYPADMNLVRTIARALLGRRLPHWSGALDLDGLDGPLTIRRDRWGIPSIDAATDHDAWFGLGFCHALDRAGQLEIILRLGRGTLAEVLGADALSIDRLSRRLQARQSAARQLEVMAPDVCAQIQAYADGINAGLRRGGRRSAHEFTLIRSDPSVWDATDVQTFVVFLNFLLAANWDIELVRLKILQEDGAEALAALDASYPDWLPVSTPPFGPGGGAVDRLGHDVQAFAEAFGLHGGSNAWAVAGSRTATGRPILANDPHLMPAAPCQWYLARMSTPEWTAVGATFVGTSAMACGHNGKMAWGITAGHADNTDVFLEEVGADGRSIRQGGGFVPCEVRREVIGVAGGGEVTEDVLITPRGPIIGPCLEGQPDAISISGTWLHPRPYRGLFSVHKARTPAELEAMFDDACTTNCSMVWADAEGSIGWLLAADLPVRRKGFGNLPLPGWDPDCGWEDEVLPAEQLPRVRDPEAGFVATANNQPTDTAPPVSSTDPGRSEPPFLGVDWLDGYRQAAIVDALGARKDWTVDSTLALQLGCASRPWEELSEAVLGLRGESADLAIGLDLLRSWDGHVTADSTGAAVFEHFLVDLTQRVVVAKAPNAAATALGEGFTELLPYNLIVTRRISHLVRLVRERPEGFFEASWEEVMAESLAAAVAALRKGHGRDTSRWAWGRVRPLTLVHLFGQKRPLDRLFNVGPIASRGDSTTIHQGSVDFREPAANPVGLPTFRMVIDVGAWSESRFILLGGQSGNPLSPHYDDQVPAWERGEGVPIAWTEAEVAAAAVTTLALRPRAGGG